MRLFTIVREPVQFLQMTKYGSCSLADNNINKTLEGFWGELGGNMEGNDNYFKGMGNKMHFKRFWKCKQVIVNKIGINHRS